MSQTVFSIKKGFWQKSRGPIQDNLDLNKFANWILAKRHVTIYDDCCADSQTTLPVRYNTETGIVEYFNGTSWVTAETAIVSNHVSLSDGTVGTLAVRIGADSNNGLYGVSDTQLGIAVEGVLVAGANTTGLFTDNIAEQTATAGVTIDSVLLKDGGITTSGAIIFGSPQTLTGAGAINLTTYATLVVTTGANALTLAAGADGQKKFIKMKTDGGDGTLTPNALQDGTTITFNDAGDFVELVYLDGKWNIIANSGATVA